MSLTYTNGASREGAGRQNRFSQSHSASLNSEATRSKQPLFAELAGDTCTSSGLTVRSQTPILALCREMIAAGMNPDQALQVFRGSTLAVRVRSIGEAAGLEINSKGTGFVRTAPPMQKNGRGRP